MLSEQMEAAYRFVWEKLYYPDTNLIYDYRVTDTPNGMVSGLPTPEEAAAAIPNPCGWGTGMEDSMLNGGSMLELLVNRYAVTGEPELRERAARIFAGMLACAECSRDPGFLARSLCTDGKGHFPESSRDQYTHWVCCARMFSRSPLSDETQRAAIRRVLRSFAERCERNVTPENGYSLMTEDGRRGLVSGMWGDAVEPHEYMRLPMIYAAAWEATGDPHWRMLYDALKEEAVAGTLRQNPARRMSSYAILQAQYSLRLVWELEPDGSTRNDIARAMELYAGMAKRYAPEYAAVADTYTEMSYRFRIPWRKDTLWYRNSRLHEGRAYFMPTDGHTDSFLRGMNVTREPGEALLIQLLCPGVRPDRDQLDAFTKIAARTDFSRVVCYGPLLMADAWWALQAAE